MKMRYANLKTITIFCVLITIFLGVRFSNNSNVMTVHFIDVGQGDATLVTTPLGKTILIDAGPHPNITQDLSTYIPIGNRKIDFLVLTHPDLDHIGGMVDVADQLDIAMMLHSGLTIGSPLYAQIFEKLDDSQIIAAQVGQIFTLEPGITLEVLHPYSGYESLEPNEHSVVVKLSHGSNSLLLTGDVSKLVEQNLVNMYGEALDVDIVKAGHHGSNTSTSQLFIETTTPDTAILSYGCNNRFGHPHINVMTTLFTSNVDMLSTCDEGTITFESDGVVWERK